MELYPISEIYCVHDASSNEAAAKPWEGSNFLSSLARGGSGGSNKSTYPPHCRRYHEIVKKPFPKERRKTQIRTQRTIYIYISKGPLVERWPIIDPDRRVDPLPNPQCIRLRQRAVPERCLCRKLKKSFGKNNQIIASKCLCGCNEVSPS